MPDRDAILIVGAGPMQVPAIEIAREMGLSTIVTDYDPEAPGLALADVPVVMSTKDVEGTVRIARRYSNTLRGVLTVGTDASVTVAAVAGALQLPGIRYEAAEKATHKVRMREALRAAGVPVPDFRGVWAIDEARAAAAAIGFPVVLKPVDNMGARGVIRADRPEDIEAAYRHAQAASTSGEVIVEAYLDGPELSIDALVYRGEVVCWGVADRIIQNGTPHFVELGHTLPSALPPDVQARACKVMEDAMRALGITHGAAKGDVKVTKDGIFIGECAARLSGGWMSSHTFPLATGYSMIRGAIEIALGRRPEIPPLSHRVAAERCYLPKRSGRITKVEGLDAVRKMPGVAAVIERFGVDDEQPPLRSNLDKTGHVIAVGETREEVERTIRSALAAIRVETTSEPEPLTMHSIEKRARGMFGALCRACKVCDGVYCAGMVPGMGGIGTGRSFMNNLAALARYRLAERVVYDARPVDPGADFLGTPIALPVLTAPITGAKTNMGGAITEEEFCRRMVRGSIAAGTIPFVGDGATPEKYRVGLAALEEAGGKGVPVFKPRPNEAVLERIRAARAAGVLAIGMDVDGAAFVTMRAKGQVVEPKSVEDLRRFVEACEDTPFVVKGVMNPRDAEAAVAAGAKVVIVSNHGGRVMDFQPGAAEVLPDIVRAIGGDATIVLDGGIRSGEDVVKGLALGADLCMIGRPVAIAAMGGGAEGVELYYRELRAGIERVLTLTGRSRIEEIGPDVLLPAA